MMNTLETRVPVTVLTGFLGAGKTTLLNRVLTENHGKKIAVIENEFGEVGIDNDLVIGAEEEIFEMNNGCICCTVRGDLIRILSHLMKRRDKFDYIMVETTGMADPGPVAQTFYVDDDMQQKLMLDAIVTVVDAKHIWEHIDDSDEAKEQVAFADVILLNKTDLVAPEDLDRLEARIKSMNSMAKVFRTRDAVVEMEKILNVGGFNLDRALEIDPKFMEPEYPFEWSGIYELNTGTYEWVMSEGPDPVMGAALLPLADSGLAAKEATLMGAVLTFSEDGQVVQAGETLHLGKGRHNQLELNRKGETVFNVGIQQPGYYMLFTEHHPDEFDAHLCGTDAVLAPLETREYKPDHEHDEEVTSVGITLPGSFHLDKLNGWLSQLLREQGQDIFRMKGVLSLRGKDERFVFQGVHMLFDGRPDRPWGHEQRQNKMVFIGRNLDRAALEEGFRACLVS